MFNIAKIDSLRVRVKKQHVKIIDERIVSEYTRFYPCIGEPDSEVFNPPPYVQKIDGITYRFYLKSFLDASKKSTEYVVFQISAKMCKSDYFEGITRKNVSQIVKDINAFNVVEVTEKRFLDGLISDIDLCINQLISMPNYKGALGLMRNFPKNGKKPLMNFINLDNGLNLGVEFNSREKGTNVSPYCKIYHKGNELKQKSYVFFDAFLQKKNYRDAFLDNLVRYEFTIKAAKHKAYLIDKGFNANLKTLNCLLNADPKDLTAIAKSGLKHYLDDRQNKIDKSKNNNLSPMDLVIKHYQGLLIDLGQDEDTLMGFTYLIDDPSSRSRTKKRISQILQGLTIDKNVKKKLDNNNKINKVLSNFGFQINKYDE